MLDGIVSREPRTYSELASCVYQAYASHVGKSHANWGDKNNVYLTEVAKIHALYPGARYILITRNVRDILCSVREIDSLPAGLSFRPELPLDALKLGQLWGKQSRLANTDLATLAAGRYITLRYEDLVSNPESTLRTIFDFLGVEWDSETLSAHEFNARLGLEPPETMAWKAFTLTPPTTQRVGRWRRDLSANDAMAVTTAAGNVFEQLGYKV